jgi:hypothetical protein
MTNYDLAADTDVIWQHLDYYVRRVDDELVLVETLLKVSPGEEAENAEIMTFYFEPEDLEEEWAIAVLEQGRDLEEGKSGDFVPPDEI